jgi:hypothetical protein
MRHNGRPTKIRALLGARYVDRFEVFGCLLNDVSSGGDGEGRIARSVMHGLREVHVNSTRLG